MNKKLFLSICFTIFIIGYAFNQVDELFPKSITETTSTEQRFQIYLDSLIRYVYHDIELCQKIISANESILKSDVIIADSTIASFYINKIYFEYGKPDPVGAFEVINNIEADFNALEISQKLEGQFAYLKNFTFMSLGDYESAQKAYFKEIEIGRTQRDTSRLCSNYYSLGQLLNDQGDYVGAVKSYLKAMPYAKSKQTNPSTLILLHLELIESYMNINDEEKILKTIIEAEELIENHNLDILKSDLLSIKTSNYIKQGELELATEVYKEMVALRKGEMDYSNIINTEKLLVEIQIAKKDYKSAIRHIKILIPQIDTNNVNELLECFSNAHLVSQKLNNYEDAYHYLSDYSKLKEKIEKDDRKQNTAYLNAKFNIEQKEKENLTLQLKVKKSQSIQNISYLLIGFSLLALSLLYYAFLQKRNYGEKLKIEVNKRTEKLRISNALLKQSNQEIEEFNRILSHDLSEPLRTIVSFSQLGKKNLDKKIKAKEYLDYVINGGLQLQTLISDVNLFREMRTYEPDIYLATDFKATMLDVMEKIKISYPNKTIALNFEVPNRLSYPKKLIRQVFELILDNAAKFNENKNVQLKITYHLKEDHHIFELSDNGIGISPEYHSHVFEMFKRLNTRDIYKGSGLGLSSAQILMEKINGDIRIEKSSIDKGTKFIISFPTSFQTSNSNAEAEQILS